MPRMPSTGAAWLACALLLAFPLVASAADPPAARAPADKLSGPPLTTAEAWAIADGKTGEILWEHHGSTKRWTASTTKVMTCWVVLELALQDRGVLDEVVTISKRAAETRGSLAVLNEGEKISVRDLVYGLMLPSGNDAAVALAEHFGNRFNPSPGDSQSDPVDHFVAEMNRRAQSLKLQQTHYFNPHGVGRNSTSARDLLKLAHAARQNELFNQYVATRTHSCTLQTPNGSTREAAWKNTNQLLGIEGYEGIKTGTTMAAGDCLVSFGRRGEDSLLVVVLGSARGGRYVDSRNLYRWAWQQRGHRDN